MTDRVYWRLTDMKAAIKDAVDKLIERSKPDE
jgi:hypothetical protein